MRALRLFVLLVLIGAFSASCGVCNGTGPDRLGTPVATPSDDVEGPDVFWGHVNDTLRALPRAWQEAKQHHPDYAQSQESANAFADEFNQSATDYLGALNKRTPPPGLETQFDALKTKLRALLDSLRASPVDGAAIDAAYKEYVSACESVQQFADASNAGVDLACSGQFRPLSAGDFVAAIAPVIAKLHATADGVQSTFAALTLAQQADLTALSVYAGGVANAYGLAAQGAADPEPPASLVAAKQSFVDAAKAVFTAGQGLEEQAKEASGPAGLQAVVASASTTLTPLRADVESACAQLQSAATSAGVTTNLGCRN